MIIFRIVSSYFCAGIIVGKSKTIIEAAPILKWATGKGIKWFLKYCKHKHWKMEFIGGEKVSISERSDRREFDSPRFHL